MIRYQSPLVAAQLGIPRESGDDPIMQELSQKENMYSPRERG